MQKKQGFLVAKLRIAEDRDPILQKTFYYLVNDLHKHSFMISEVHDRYFDRRFLHFECFENYKITNNKASNLNYYQSFRWRSEGEISFNIVEKPTNEKHRPFNVEELNGLLTAILKSKTVYIAFGRNSYQVKVSKRDVKRFFDSCVSDVSEFAS